MRIVKSLGFVLAALGIVLGVLSFVGVLEVPVGLLLLPTIGVILILTFGERTRRARR